MNSKQPAVIFEDESILVVSKPAGLLSVPDGYDPAVPHLPGVLEPEFGRLWVVHRLDADTSGIILLARSESAHRRMNEQFEARQVEKVYHALVAGLPGWTEIRVNLPLKVDGDRRHRTLVDPREGKPAATRLKVLERLRAYALVEARPETGRTHQIRVHLASQGFPVTGDTLYGNGEGVYLSRAKTKYKSGRGEERPMVARLALHARSLTFIHPSTGSQMTIEAPYPKDFEAALHQLRKASA